MHRIDFIPSLNQTVMTQTIYRASFLDFYVIIFCEGIKSKLDD